MLTDKPLEAGVVTITQTRWYPGQSGVTEFLDVSPLWKKTFSSCRYNKEVGFCSQHRLGVQLSILLCTSTPVFSLLQLLLASALNTNLSTPPHAPPHPWQVQFLLSYKKKGGAAPSLVDPCFRLHLPHHPPPSVGCTALIQKLFHPRCWLHCSRGWSHL